MGTSPKEVEEYMDSILHLGRSWGCVVLLDEADTFLEQRTSKDLERNALVTVFLRVLEYYDGILILTSNRVGSFDEAFKSRIQLALQYSSLTKAQRREIWKNFLSRFKDIEESPTWSVANLTEPGSRKRKFAKSSDIDFDDVDRYIDDLAGFQMNGRQIRNAITTARQLATYKGERMMYRHLHHTIAVANKFDKYLLELHDGLSDDQLARETGVR
jgi:SpoVK/Ycf46/Vps4 family AAA+-type ATPase